jgi:hypothetical protein
MKLGVVAVFRQVADRQHRVNPGMHNVPQSIDHVAGHIPQEAANNLGNIVMAAGTEVTGISVSPPSELGQPTPLSASHIQETYSVTK